MSSEYLKQIVAQALNVPPEDVTDNTSSDTLEAWDSLGHLEVVLAVEQATNTKFNTSEIPRLTSVEQLQKALEQRGWSG